VNVGVLFSCLSHAICLGPRETLVQTSTVKEKNNKGLCDLAFTFNNVGLERLCQVL
jgi:hypothetical protein